MKPSGTVAITVPAMGVQMDDLHTRLLFPAGSCYSSDVVCSPCTSTPLQLRPLLPKDLLQVKALCEASFPISYPSAWYDEVVSGALTSVGFFEGNTLAAMIVSELKPLAACNPEDRDIVANPRACVVYILSLAVSSNYRRMGLATKLLKFLLDVVDGHAPYPQAVFLHVLSTNFAAIQFYKRNGFKHHDTLLNYYRIGESYGDGFSYVRYANGGRPPITAADVCRALTTALCFPVKALLKLAIYP